jgi:hypothetical protein
MRMLGTQMRDIRTGRSRMLNCRDEAKTSRSRNVRGYRSKSLRAAG